MKKLGDILILTVMFICVALFMAYWALFNSVQRGVLNYLPAAPTSTQVTLRNYDAFQVYVMEHDRLKAPVKGWSKDGKVTRKVHGSYVVRALGDDVYLLPKDNDAKFPVFEYFPTLLTGAVKVEKGVDFAKRQCKNKGCAVKVSVVYDFGADQSLPKKRTIGDKIFDSGKPLFSSDLKVTR